MRKHVLILFIIFFLFGNSIIYAQQITLSPDQINAVEHATFTDLQGNTFKLSDYRGKVVLIDFWETWCGPCVNSMPTVNQLVKKYPKNFAVIAVTPGFSDSKEQTQNFVNAHHYDFHYAYGDQLAKELQITGIPYKVFVDANGKFISVMMGSLGPSGDFKEIQNIIRNHEKTGNS